MALPISGQFCCLYGQANTLQHPQLITFKENSNQWISLLVETASGSYSLFLQNFLFSELAMSLDINYLMLDLRNVFNLPKIFTNGSFSQIRFTVYLRSCEGLCVFFFMYKWSQEFSNSSKRCSACFQCFVGFLIALFCTKGSLWLLSLHRGKQMCVLSQVWCWSFTC